MVRCDKHEYWSKVCVIRKAYRDCLEECQQEYNAPVRLVMLTITPPGTLDPQVETGWEKLTKEDRYERWHATPGPIIWREKYVAMMANLRRTHMWESLGFVAGIWAYECPIREPGEWIEYTRKGSKEPGRLVEDWEMHPHVHIVALQDTERGFTGKQCADYLTEYTEAHGFGFVNYKGKKSKNIRKAVNYAVKYVLKEDSGGGGKRRGVFGMMVGKQTARKMRRKYNAIRRRWENAQESPPQEIGEAEGSPKQHDRNDAGSISAAND